MRIRINTKITVKYGMQLVCAVAIALIPILFSYKQVFSISPTYLALILCAPFVLMRLANRKAISVKNLGWIAAYLLYCMASHGIGFSEIIVTVLFLLYALAANNGVFYEKLIWKSVVVISCIATVGIFLQTVCYYLLGMRLYLCPTNLMDEVIKEVSYRTLSSEAKLKKFLLQHHFISVFCYIAQLRFAKSRL